MADHWYPADLQLRARVDEYLSWQHMNIRSNGSKAFLLRVRPASPTPPRPRKVDFPSWSSLSGANLPSGALPGLVNVCERGPDAALKVETKVSGDQLINADLIWSVFIRSSFSAGEEHTKIQESCHCASLCLLTSLKPVSADQVLFPLMMGSEAPQDKMDAAIEDLKQALSLLEKQFLQDKAFIVGNQISLADLVAIVEIMQVKVAKEKRQKHENC